MQEGNSVSEMIDLNLAAAVVFGGLLFALVLFAMLRGGAGAQSSSGPTLYIDCDDTMYRNDWKVAKMITDNIEEYVTKKLKLPEGKAYELYKKHGTALRGLQQEKLVEFDEDDFLEKVHHLPEAKRYIQPDPKLKAVLNAIRVDKWVFTASVSEHARRCMDLLGVTSCFQNPVIDVRATQFYTKHDERAYALAERLAGQRDPRNCYIVDDSWSNIRAAKNRGWNTALVGLKSRDGKDARTHCKAADHIVADLKNLPDVWPHLFASSPRPAARDEAKQSPKPRKKSKKKSRKAD